MTEKTTEQEAMRELAHRVIGGVDVKLLWSKADDRLEVRVRDTRSGDSFRLEAPRDRALDVFYHPYAHAALQRIAFHAARAGRVFAEPYAPLPPRL